MRSEKISAGAPQPEISKNLENFLSHEIPRQYEACTTSLRNTGLLEEIFSEQENDLVIKVREGITGMDGKKYEFPSAEKIAKHFSAEKYKEKFEQGFTKLLIVPFGYPLATLRIRYQEQLLKYHRGGMLHDRGNNKLELDVNMPLSLSITLDHSDETGSMIYYPKQFDKANHGGKTKQELLDDKNQPFPGFHVLLIKPDLIIPREGNGKTTETRKDIEANKSPTDYLKLLTERQYRHEQGFTLEDSIVLAMTHLHQSNKIIDDWENDTDSLNFNVGNFHAVSGDVPGSCWSRHYRQAGVGGYFSGVRGASTGFGARVAVA